ncbi:MAG: PepSY-associated TM helix domain-containing protein [Methyloglobulus sp.]|nr:hypothetical protein [Methyloglobulus sp.]
MYDPTKGIYRVLVHTDREPTDYVAGSFLWFDAVSGVLKLTSLRHSEKIGNTITAWLVSLHMAIVWGLPYKILVCLMGFVITMLSVTGVYI